MKRITIVGAGLCGSFLAVLLAQRGYQVKVYERRSDPRKNVIDGGRSINLVVSHRGWTALKVAGLEDRVRAITVPVYGRMMHDRQGNTSKQAYSADGRAIHSVSRGGLNEELITAAEAFEKVQFHFDHKCANVDLDTATCTFVDEAGNTLQEEADVVVGADGAFSLVRKHMLSRRVNFSQHYIEHDYKELLIPSMPDGTPQMDPQSLHIWPRSTFMLMGLANLDGGFTGTLFWPRKGENSFASIRSDSEVLACFQKEFPDVIPMVPDLVEQYADNPTASLISVRCDPWHYKDKVVLIGDAAHAIVPFYGEGMNCGLEDCRIFSALLDSHGGDNMGDVFKEYSESRVKNGHAIAELSMRNFVEMRDSVGNEKFLLRKKIERRLHQDHPDKWLPLYSQVKFSDIEYKEALAEGKRHDQVMERILRIPDIRSRWEDPAIQAQALEMLASLS